MSSSSSSLLSLLTYPPALLLPVQLLALALPSFPHRATVFVPLILYLAYLTHTSTDLPADPSARAPLLSQWPWYLGTIAKLSFARPEYDYHRTGRPAGEALSLGPLGKVAWAGSLLVSLRGVGWNWQVRGVPAAWATAAKGRLWFAVTQLCWLLFCWLALDALEFYKDEYLYRDPRVEDLDLTLYTEGLGRQLWHSVWGLFTPYFSLNMLYGQLAVACVLLGVGGPADWPPLYGPLASATTLRRFWNTWWHQCVRGVYTAYSGALLRLLGIRRGTTLSSYVQLYASFILSATGHALVLYGLPYSPRHTFWDRAGMFWCCFAMQAPAIHAEDCVIWCWEQVAGASGSKERVSGSGSGRSGREDERRKEKGEPSIHTNIKRINSTTSNHRSRGSSRLRWQRWLGRLWLVAWVWLHSLYIADPCLKMGLARQSPLPFSLLRPALEYLGWTVVVRGGVL